MTKNRLAFLTAALLLGTAICAHAQGTNPATRNGSYGSSYGAGTATTSPATPSAPSSTSQGYRAPAATGQRSSEGALGMSPQLQRELGINRQQ